MVKERTPPKKQAIKKKLRTDGLETINGFLVLNTSGLTIHQQWQPPSTYTGKVLEAWEKAVRDVYRMCRTEVPKDIQFGFIYGDSESGRVGNTFLISPWTVSKQGSYGIIAFRKRYTHYIKNAKGDPGMRDRFQVIALVEVAKTVKDTIDSW